MSLFGLISFKHIALISSLFLMSVVPTIFRSIILMIKIRNKTEKELLEKRIKYVESCVLAVDTVRKYNTPKNDKFKHLMVYDILCDIKILLNQKLAIYELIKLHRFLTLGAILILRYDLIIIWYHIRLFFSRSIAENDPTIDILIPTDETIRALTESDKSNSTEDNDADDTNNGHNSCSKDVVTNIPLDNKAINRDISDTGSNKVGYFHEARVNNVATKQAIDVATQTDDYYNGTDSKVNNGCNTLTTTTGSNDATSTDTSGNTASGTTATSGTFATATTTTSVDSSGSLVKDNNINIKAGGSDGSNGSGDSKNSGINIQINLGNDNVNITISNGNINITICKEYNASVNTNKDKECCCNCNFTHCSKIVNRNIERCSEEFANLSTKAISEVVTERITEPVKETEYIPSIITEAISEVAAEPIKDTESIPSISTEVIAQTTTEDEPIKNATVEVIPEDSNDKEAVVNLTTAEDKTKTTKDTEPITNGIVELRTESTKDTETITNIANNDTETDSNIVTELIKESDNNTETDVNTVAQVQTETIIDTAVIAIEDKETVTQPIIENEVIAIEDKETVTQPIIEDEVIAVTEAVVTTEPTNDKDIIADTAAEVTTETIIEDKTTPSITAEVTTEPIIENEVVTTINNEVTNEPSKDKEPVPNANTEVRLENKNDEKTVANTTDEAMPETPKEAEVVANTTEEVATNSHNNNEVVANNTEEVVPETAKEAEVVADETVEVVGETVEVVGETPKDNAAVDNTTTEVVPETANDNEVEVVDKTTKEPEDINKEQANGSNSKFIQDKSVNLSPETIKRSGEASRRGVKFQMSQESSFSDQKYFQSGNHKPDAYESRSKYDKSYNRTYDLDDRRNIGSGWDKVKDNEASDLEFGYSPNDNYDNYNNFRADHFKGNPKYNNVYHSDSENEYNRRNDRYKRKPKFYKKRDDSHLKGDLGALAVVRRIHKLRHADLDQNGSYIRVGPHYVHVKEREKEITKYSRHFQQFSIELPEDSE